MDVGTHGSVRSESPCEQFVYTHLPASASVKQKVGGSHVHRGGVVEVEVLVEVLVEVDDDASTSSPQKSRSGVVEVLVEVDVVDVVVVVGSEQPSSTKV